MASENKNCTSDICQTKYDQKCLDSICQTIPKARKNIVFQNVFRVYDTVPLQK